MLLMICVLLVTSIYFAAYQFLNRAKVEESHLPSQIFRTDETVRLRYPGQPPKTWSPLSSKYKIFEKRLNLPFNLKHKLITAGSPIGPLEFLAFETLSLLFVPLVCFIVIGNKMPQHMLLIISVMTGAFIPFFWLRQKINKRQFQMKKDLPLLIDLLNICVSGGLDFMLAVNRVLRDMKPCDLTNELAEVYRETQMGATRREALKNFAWRVDMPEVHSFVRTLVQADRMGTSIGEALKQQSEEIKVKRFQRGEAMALKAPIKLLFPLFAFIMPVVLIIVAGPILLSFFRGNMSASF